MNEHIDHLSDTFAAHEYLAPDPVEVLAKANLRARSYRRRRRAARATGVSVLGAGIVAGGVTLPSLKWHRQNQGQLALSQPLSASVTPSPGETSTPIAIASSAPSPTVSPTVSAVTSPTPSSSPIASATPSPSPTAAATHTEQQELDAFFGDGYDYNDAVALSSLWHETDIGTVKADAGQKLLNGETLPVAPTGTPETAQEKDMNAFWDAGYGYQDAVTLGKLWNITDMAQVKADAGQKLLDGQTLPISPSTSSAAPTVGSAPAEAVTSGEPLTLVEYFAAGYDYNDALSLSALWHDTDVYQVKVDAGQKLLAGQTLPVKPTSTPESASNRDLDAYFAAGYDYNDAVALGTLWHQTDLDQIKTTAGQKLLAGQTLPIAPTNASPASS